MAAWRPGKHQYHLLDSEVLSFTLAELFLSKPGHLKSAALWQYPRAAEAALSFSGSTSIAISLSFCWVHVQLASLGESKLICAP